MTRFLAAFSLLFYSSAYADPVPNFETKTGRDSSQSWIVEFHPPAKHHFNLKAPTKVQSGEIVFTKVVQEPNRLGFESQDPKLKEGAEGKASLFLCDDAETYCVNKTAPFQLTANSDLHSLSGKTPPKETATPKNKKQTKKDEFGFWDNDLNGALTEAQLSKKPLLIDFYGIWCPPCNLYNETVFNTTEFKLLSNNWVLLKLDADQESSFAIKSHFKVGGYPTISLIKAPVEPKTDALEEIDRIVGFYPIGDFKRRVNAAYLARNLSLEERLASQKDAFLSNLKRLVQINLEKKNDQQVLEYVAQGLPLDPNHFFAATKLQVEGKKEHTLFKKEESLNLLKTIWTNREKEDVDTLQTLIEILTENSDSFSTTQIAMAKDAIDSLQKRINPKTFSIDGQELSTGDLAELSVDVAKAMKDEKALKAAYEKGVDAYERLNTLQGGESRGLNLELGYYLYQSGRVEEAKKLYSHFIQKYPNEFTFYYAAARMGIETKDLKNARENAEKAVQYAYGDNQIRSMELLIRVMGLQGERRDAVLRGKKFLENAKSDPNLSVRTDRYLNAFKKTLSEVEEEGQI